MSHKLEIEARVYDDELAYLKMRNSWLEEDLIEAQDKNTALLIVIAKLERDLKMKKAH